MTGTAPLIEPIAPAAARIPGTNATKRVIHQDPRGFLVEMLRDDDAALRGDHFAMSYTSVTVAGAFRDRDQWHFHPVQSDRFVVPLGEMTLALFDARKESPTYGHLEVIRLTGAPFHHPNADSKQDIATEMVEVPPGVYHSLGNLTADTFVVVNFPTERYNAADEGRIPFADVIIPGRGATFDWGQVARRAPGPGSGSA
jgi:dTDP-4-dehydrorhamnose 3,5-epimerase